MNHKLSDATVADVAMFCVVFSIFVGPFLLAILGLTLQFFQRRSREED